MDIIMNTKFKKIVIKILICSGIVLLLGALASYLISNMHQNAQNQKSLVSASEVKIQALSRDEAYEAIRSTTTKVFDPKDQESISTHLTRMKELTQHLHPEKDKKTITAIHFLLENQHRSSGSVFDQAFWLKASIDKEFTIAIPLSPETAKRGQKEMSKTLLSKMSLQTQNSKDLLGNKNQQKPLLLI